MEIEYKWLGQGVDFETALGEQEAIVRSIQEDRSQPAQFWFLEHAPVYTIGARSVDPTLPKNHDHLPHPVVQINRGGLATYHGPGQLVGYVFVDLKQTGKDLHQFLRLIEEALIQTAEHFGVPAGREDGLTGVWVRKRKMASIGVGVRKWVTMHGFALNITPESLPPFQMINPCGIDGVVMTALHQEGEKFPTPEEFSKVVFEKFRAELQALSL